MPKSFLFSLLSALCVLFLCSCSPNDLPGVVTITPPAPTAGPSTATAFAVEGALASLTPAPTEIPVMVSATPAAGGTTTPTALPTDSATASTRPLYAMDASMNYTAKSIDVTQEITYLNQTGEGLSQLVLAVEP